jgi:excisionase family DNA binding protein
METTTASPHSATKIAETERLAYSIQESADLLGVDYFSVYRLIQRGKLRACRALRGKLLVPRSELLRLLNGKRVYGISGRSALSDYKLERLWSAETFGASHDLGTESTKMLRAKDAHPVRQMLKRALTQAPEK